MPRRISLTRVFAGLAFGLCLGLGASLLLPASGCVVPDQCILVWKPGWDWCAALNGATMWPAGQPELAEPVLDEAEDVPVACVCFNDAEHEVLFYGTPADYRDELAGQVEQATRDFCESLVPAGFEHNCDDEGPDGPTLEAPLPEGLGDCVGDCAFTDPCGDPTPYECEFIVDEGGDEAGLPPRETDTDTGGSESGTDTGNSETGTDTGGFNPTEAIFCTGDVCEVDADFAALVYADPTILAAEGTRLVYDTEQGRFSFAGAWPGSTAHTLGFRDGDLLESVDGVTIDGLDAGLDAFANSANARTLRVRILRGSTWLDFTFIFG